MTIIRVSTRFDGFSKPNARLDKIEVDVESAAKSFRNNVKMELALRGKDRLAKFRVRGEMKRGIFAVQRGKSGRNFVFLAFGPGLQSGMERRFRIHRHRKYHGPVREA